MDEACDSLHLTVIPVICVYLPSAIGERPHSEWKMHLQTLVQEYLYNQCLTINVKIKPGMILLLFCNINSFVLAHIMKNVRIHVCTFCLECIVSKGPIFYS